MNKYELNGNIIETTESRYENTFKALGYVPYKEKKKIEDKKDDMVVEKKNEKDK